MRVQCQKMPKEGARASHLELQVVVIYRVNAGTWTEVLCENSKRSYPLSRFPLAPFLPFLYLSNRCLLTACHV